VVFSFKASAVAGVLIVPISYLTRIVDFSATHYIRRADWPTSGTPGVRAGGGGARPQLPVPVTVKGPLVAEAGGVMGLEALDRLLAEEITRRLDGRSINEALPEFAPGHRLATGEALAVYVVGAHRAPVREASRLHAVRVQEGPHIYSEYFGEP